VKDRRQSHCLTCTCSRQSSLDAAFWAKVDQTDRNGCWPWAGAYFSHGYGSCRIVIRGQQLYYAHRVAWVIANARTIPKGLAICHRCDYPPCCNPAHLFLATNDENVADRVAKGRTARHHGEDHPAARLTSAQVREIRTLHDQEGL